MSRLIHRVHGVSTPVLLGHCNTGVLDAQNQNGNYFLVFDRLFWADGRAPRRECGPRI